METDITSLSQFKKMLAQRKRQPLVIVERYGWREMGHGEDIYEPRTILRVDKKELTVDWEGKASSFTFPPAGELKFPGGTRMEHWGKDKTGKDVVLLAYEWPEKIDVERAERCKLAFDKTAAAFDVSVKEAQQKHQQKMDANRRESMVHKEAEEAVAGQWIGEHSKHLRSRTDTLAKPGEGLLFLLHQETKDNQEHYLFVLCDSERSLYLVDARQGPQERDGQKVWEATEWPLSPQSLRFRMRDLPGLVGRVENPRNYQPRIFDPLLEAQNDPAGFWQLPKALEQRARATSASPHELLDVKITPRDKSKPAMVEVTHRSAFMAGPQTVKFIPDRQLAGKGEAQMLAVIEAAKAHGALEFSGGRLRITKPVETDRLKAQPGAFQLVAESATSAGTGR